ncbi:serine/threonine/tyrosine-interacting-like protein 1 isoform X2 [Narcine bancroftii]
MDGNYLMPEDVEVECVRYCVVYDEHTNSLNDKGLAIEYANLLQVVSRQPIRVLNGGYKHFSACYPFFRTQKIFYMPQELDAFEPYPIEILPAKLYLGDYKQSCNPQIQKDLKFRAFINLCHEKEIITAEDQDIAILHISSSEVIDFFTHFPTICNFLDKHLDKGAACIVSTLGISRCSTVVMAYLIYCQKLPLKDVWAHVKKCKAAIRPLRDFVHHLSQWEEAILKEKITDVSDPYY